MGFINTKSGIQGCRPLEQVEMMRKLALKNHVTLKLDDTSLPPAETLQQYQIHLNEDFDKFLVLLSFLKLKIVRGKSLVFVCGTNRCYKLKLFLKQFGLASIVLSSELAASSRHNAVQALVTFLNSKPHLKTKSKPKPNRKHKTLLLT